MTNSQECSKAFNDVRISHITVELRIEQDPPRMLTCPVDLNSDVYKSFMAAQEKLWRYYQDHYEEAQYQRVKRR